MDLSRLNPQSRVVPSALPRTLPGGKPAVLLFHGFTGYPGNLYYVAGELQKAGFTVRVPRLPGHGTDGIDFLSSNWRDWLRRAVDEYLELASQQSPVYVAGLSMGALLSSIIASRFPVERVALLAPAFEVRNRLIAISGIAGLFVKRYRSGEHESYDDPDREYISGEYWDYTWPSLTWGVYRLQRMARRSLPRISGRVLTIVSEMDETVPPSVAALIERGAPQATPRTIVLRESSHVITRDVEAERVAQELLSFFG